jgi:hypothetical protein
MRSVSPASGIITKNLFEKQLTNGRAIRKKENV